MTADPRITAMLRDILRDLSTIVAAHTRIPHDGMRERELRQLADTARDLADDLAVTGQLSTARYHDQEAFVLALDLQRIRGRFENDMWDDDEPAQGEKGVLQ
jgi:hypothetical protein